MNSRIMKILIICTGNSCRSQMAEGFLKAFLPEAEISSAGTRPEKTVNPYAQKVMKEAGLDISRQFPKNVDLFLDEAFDYVITVCDSAKQVCPVFQGKVKHRMHLGFEDPADTRGTEEEILAVYRNIRDQIKEAFGKFAAGIKLQED
jgi:arsenate reductase (thioredoxin)